MTTIMDALRARGVEDSDVQTTQFSIEPQYGKPGPYYMEGKSPVGEIGAFMEVLESMSSEDSGEKDLEDGEAFAGFMEMLLAMGMMAGEEVGGYPGDPGILVDDYRVDGLTPIGYRVTNDVVVKVRDLAAVGAVIDEVVQAGGDACARGWRVVQRRGHHGSAPPGQGNGYGGCRRPCGRTGRPRRRHERQAPERLRGVPRRHLLRRVRCPGRSFHLRRSPR